MIGQNGWGFFQFYVIDGDRLEDTDTRVCFSDISGLEEAAKKLCGKFVGFKSIEIVGENPSYGQGFVCKIHTKMFEGEPMSVFAKFIPFANSPEQYPLHFFTLEDLQNLGWKPKRDITPQEVYGLLRAAVGKLVKFKPQIEAESDFNHTIRYTDWAVFYLAYQDQVEPDVEYDPDEEEYDPYDPDWGGDGDLDLEDGWTDESWNEYFSDGY